MCPPRNARKTPSKSGIARRWRIFASENGSSTFIAGPRSARWSPLATSRCITIAAMYDEGATEKRCHVVGSRGTNENRPLDPEL